MHSVIFLIFIQPDEVKLKYEQILLNFIFYNKEQKVNLKIRKDLKSWTKTSHFYTSIFILAVFSNFLVQLTLCITTKLHCIDDFHSSKYNNYWLTFFPISLTLPASLSLLLFLLLLPL